MKYKLKNKYVFGVLMAIVVLTINQLFIQYWLNQKNEDSRIINLSGRQRMLSQKINLEYFQIVNQKIKSEELLKTFKNWETVHLALLNGNNALGIGPVKNLEARAILTKLSNNIDFIHKSLNSRHKVDLNVIQKISENQAHFLTQMEYIVKVLEEDSDKKLRFIIFIEIFLAIISIVIIAAEVIYIYQPIEKELLKTIGELESSEGKLLAIINSSTDSSIFISPDLKIINFNKSAEENVKILHKKELKEGIDFKPFVLLSSEENFYEAFNLALKGEITSRESALTIEGEKIWFRIRYFPVYDRQSKIIGVTFNATNIDERKKAEMRNLAQLEILKDIAWQQSHVLRNPVANILGVTQMLLDKDFDLTFEEKDSLLRQLAAETFRLDAIIKDIVRKTY